MKYKLLIMLLIALDWSTVSLLIKARIPSFPGWIAFLPFIAVGGLISITLVLLIILIIILIIILCFSDEKDMLKDMFFDSYFDDLNME